MKFLQEKRCRYCNELQVYDRQLHHFSCPTCTRKPNSYLKQIRHEQKKLARMIFEMVINLNEVDIVRLRHNEFDNNHHCQHCNRILPPDIIPVNTIPADTQTNSDPGIGQRRKRKHH